MFQCERLRREAVPELFPLRSRTGNNPGVRADNERGLSRRAWALIAAAAGIVLAGSIAAVWIVQSRAAAAREPKSLHLPDGTAAYFRGDTLVQPAAGYPVPKGIHVDGDAFIQLPETPGPWTVR